jgi:hypothetical protein
MNGRINLEAFKNATEATGVATNFFGKVAGETSYGDKSGLMEVGRISIGEKRISQGGKEYPAATDYFVVKSRHAQHVHNQYGPKPQSLPIFFFSDDFSHCCFERLELRDKAGNLFVYGDGENFHVYNPKSGNYVPTNIHQKPNIIKDASDYLRQGMPDPSKIDWTQVLYVRFIIKDIPAMGFWQFSTRGMKTTIPNLRDMFDQCLQTFGTVRFFPFELSVKLAKSNKPGENRQYPVVDIVPSISIESGLKIAEFIQDNPDFNQARLANMNLKDGTDISATLQAGTKPLQISSGSKGEE